MDATQALESIDSISGKIGNDEEIESAMAELVTLKDFLLTVEGIFNEHEEEINRLNKKTQELLTSNNQLFRQLATQEDKLKQAKDEIDNAMIIANMI